MASKFPVESELGEVLLESRPSRVRRIALSAVLLPIGLSLVYSSLMFAAFHLGVLEGDNWDVPVWFAPVPLAAGLLFLLADWWYLIRAFRCHEYGVSTQGLFRTNRLPFRAIKGVRMRITELQWLGIMVVLRTLEVWFDPKDRTHQQIAFTYNGIRLPEEFATKIGSIVESVGITPQWDSRSADLSGDQNKAT